MFASQGKLLLAFGLCLGLLLTITHASAQNASKESESWRPMQPRKRQAIVKLDPVGSAAAKSYDPPPEFYRGPGSSPSKLDSTAAGFISKPIGALPPVGGAHGSQASGLNDNLSQAYDKWKLGGNIHDRISVGHYGGSGSAGKSYAYDSHPYQYDYGPSNGHGYEPGPAPGHSYSSSGEAGVPYHVYRPRPEHGHYPGPPVDYSYSSYPIDSHEIVSHKGTPEISPKALLAKSFLIPLASATVLGIAAALVSNPLLLQLAPVPGIGVGVGVGPTVVGKRRRRRRAVMRA
ncbi:GD12416 [Drosophila simulans]|uniref:GD12416 n=1 Tax=Drosophila simulans TaxID=7240 RepID=B4QNG6_DROSI|nr:GD12416 [Drosophila simulans]